MLPSRTIFRALLLTNCFEYLHLSFERRGYRVARENNFEHPRQERPGKARPHKIESEAPQPRSSALLVATYSCCSDESVFSFATLSGQLLDVLAQFAATADS